MRGSPADPAPQQGAAARGRARRSRHPPCQHASARGGGCSPLPLVSALTGTLGLPETRELVYVTEVGSLPSPCVWSADTMCDSRKPAYAAGCTHARSRQRPVCAGMRRHHRPAHAHVDPGQHRGRRQCHCAATCLRRGSRPCEHTAAALAQSVSLRDNGSLLSGPLVATWAGMGEHSHSLKWFGASSASLLPRVLLQRQTGFIRFGRHAPGTGSAGAAAAAAATASRRVLPVLRRAAQLRVDTAPTSQHSSCQPGETHGRSRLRRR